MGGPRRAAVVGPLEEYAAGFPAELRRQGYVWLGHEQADTTQIYLHADLTIKEQALARTTPPEGKPGRYQPPDALLAFLESL